MNAFREDAITGKPLLLNVEYRNAGVPAITLVDPTSQEDIVKALVADGFLLRTTGRDRKLKDLVSNFTISFYYKKHFKCFIYIATTSII